MFAWGSRLKEAKTPGLPLPGAWPYGIYEENMGGFVGYPRPLPSPDINPPTHTHSKPGPQGVSGTTRSEGLVCRLQP